MGLPRLESRITVPTGGWQVQVTDDVGTGSVTVPADDYYMADLIGALETVLDARGGAGGYTVSVESAFSDTASGKVSIERTAGTFTAISWTSTALRDALGFTGSEVISSRLVTSANSSPRLWLPNVGRMPLEPDPESTSYELGHPEWEYMVADAPDGTLSVAVLAERYVLPLFLWENVRGYKAWRALEQVGNESFEKWAIELASTEGGAPFKYFPDRDDSRAWELQFEDLTELRAQPIEKGWVGTNSLWVIGPYRCRKYEN